MTFALNFLRHAAWPVIAIAISVLMLAAVHALERFGGYPACPLCLRQREVYWALIFMGLTGLGIWRFAPKQRFLVALNVLIGLVFGVGAVVAFYHSGVEWGWFPPPTGCSASDAPFDPMAEIDLTQKFDLALCTSAPFRILGLSLAGWNGVASVVFALTSFAAAWLTFRASQKTAL
jgi:disulfide bond formation protein DsbB